MKENSKYKTIPRLLNYKPKYGGKGCERENKNYHSIPFLSDAEMKIPKQIDKKFKKLKIPLWRHFKPKQGGKGRERVKIKIIVPFRSYPKRNRKFHKNS